MDKKLIEEKLLYIKELLKKLQKRIKLYENASDNEEKETLFAAMSKFGEEIVEIGIKINTLLLESQNDFATSYYESFTKLENHFKIDTELFEKLARTTGLRNRISHEYENINKEITLKSLRQLIPLYETYIASIIEILEKK